MTRSVAVDRRPLPSPWRARDRSVSWSPTRWCRAGWRSACATGLRARASTTPRVGARADRTSRRPATTARLAARRACRFPCVRPRWASPSSRRRASARLTCACGSGRRCGCARSCRSSCETSRRRASHGFRRMPWQMCPARCPHNPPPRLAERAGGTRTRTPAGDSGRRALRKRSRFRAWRACTAPHRAEPRASARRVRCAVSDGLCCFGEASTCSLTSTYRRFGLRKVPPDAEKNLRVQILRDLFGFCAVLNERPEQPAHEIQQRNPGVSLCLNL